VKGLNIYTAFGMKMAEGGAVAKVSGRDRINIPDMGGIALSHLMRHGVKTFADLARTDPYSYNLRFLGEKLEGWVNYSRRVIADEVIKEIHIGDSIIVRCSKEYEAELTLQAVKTRLGIYEYYVETDRRELPDMYEFIFTVNRQHRQYALGSWLEYKQTARALRERLKGAVREEVHRIEEVKVMPYTELLSLFAPEVLDVGDVGLVKETLIHLLFADRLHVMVVSEPSVAAKSTLRRAAERYVKRFINHHCGSSMSSADLAEAFSSMSEGVLSLEGLDAMTAEEKMVIGDLLSEQKVKVSLQGETFEYPAKLNIYAQANPKSSRRRGKGVLPVEEKVLKEFHCVIFARPYTPAEFEKILRFIPVARRPDEEQCRAVRRFVEMGRTIQPEHDGPPDEVYDFLKAVYRQRDRLAVPITPELEKGVIELSKAHSRIRLSGRVTRDDFLYGLKIIQACLETCGYQPKSGKP